MTGRPSGSPTKHVQRPGTDSLEVKRVGTSVVLQLELEKATHTPCQIIRWNCLAFCEMQDAFQVCPHRPLRFASQRRGLVVHCK